MKKKTVYTVLGIAAVVGVVWYLKNKKPAPAPAAAVAANKPILMIPTEKPKKETVNVPGTLLQTTSGNNGIVPPSLQQQALKIAQAIPLRPMRTIESSRINLAGHTLN